MEQEKVLLTLKFQNLWETLKDFRSWRIYADLWTFFTLPTSPTSKGKKQQLINEPRTRREASCSLASPRLLPSLGDVPEVLSIET